MKKRAILLLFVAASLPLHADVITLGAEHDNSIFSNNVNNSAGGGPGLFAGRNGMGALRRALISFDLSSIPSGATITDVQLTLTLGQVSGGATSATIGLFELTQGWGEGSVGASDTIGGSGQGVAAGEGDATWNAAFYSATTPTLWTTPGGDHASTASASLFLDSNVVDTAFTWLSTADLVADVQGWIENPATNFGWELINANETSNNTLYGFYSREWSESGKLPSLQVTYTIPEPATVALCASALLALGFARRRDARAA